MRLVSQLPSHDSRIILISNPTDCVDTVNNSFDVILEPALGEMSDGSIIAWRFDEVQGNWLYQ